MKPVCFKSLTLPILLLLCTLPALRGQAGDVPAAEDILIADFEGEDYGAWTAEGEAFGPGPARGTLPGQMAVSGYKGKGLVNTFFRGDDTTGVLTSPPFTIERDFIHFLIGGGMHPGEACIDLLVNGQVARTATGPNDRPGGSERLDWHSWDVSDLRGMRAAIRITDSRTGGWGHINIDHIVLSGRPQQEAPASREIAVEHPYLHLPVKNGARMRRMRFVADDVTVREFDIELAGGEPDFWVFADVSAFRGRVLRIAVDRLDADSTGLAAIVPADDVPAADGLYRETYRPRFHFSSRRGWNNDPNGLVFSRGEYHLFFQHNPYGWRWGNMHWGHAVSRDLVHWKELPVALYPQRYGDWCYSGSAVVDRGDTAGFRTGEEDVIVAAYTSTGRGESIAFSNDKGRTFTDYAGNPVVRHTGRDPKIIRYEPDGHWVMAVYDKIEESNGIAFYTSPDLKEWTFKSRIDGFYECPEIFELPVDGGADGTKWVVYAADGAYALGSFDGKVFEPETGKLRFNHGDCFYASQTFNNIPADDGRRIQIAWGRVGHPDMPFNQMMNFPVELTLRSTAEGIRLFAEPVREIALLHRKTRAWSNVPLREGDNPLGGIAGDLFHIEAELAPGNAKELGLVIRGIPVSFDCTRNRLACRQSAALLAPEDGLIRLEILVDRTSIEIFGNSGRVYMPMGVIPDDGQRNLEIFARGGAARIVSLAVHALRSAWFEAE